MALPILDGNQTAATLSTIITGGAHIPAHTVVSLGSQAISDITSGVSGSVVSISNFPSTQTIAGTVTAVIDPQRYDSFMGEPILPMGWATADGDVVVSFNLVTQAKPLPVSGTVTANAGGDFGGAIEIVNDVSNVSHKIAVQLYDDSGSAIGISSNPLPISGTVTVGGLPSGALTTRFGSVTTANTAQITSAVTNTSRRYLLAQNISAGTVTIGIGFSPTTTQGIQLPAGGGLTFDAFCPTGAVYWLGAVTGAAFTILEG